MTSAKRLLALIFQIKAAARLMASGLFDAKSYAQMNPDVPGPDIRRAWHYVRFGQHEERRFVRDALSMWLVPHLIDGQVSAKSVQKLVANLAHANNTQESILIGKFCGQVGLRPAGYAFYRDYLRGAFDLAESCIPELTPEEAFQAAHRMAVRQLRTRHLEDAFEWGLKQLSKPNGTARLTALADMAECLGRDTPDFSHRLLEAFLPSADAAPDSLQASLWRLRIPCLPDASGLVPIKKVLPISLFDALNNDRSPTPPSTAGWEPVLNAAGYNALAEKPVRLMARFTENGDLAGWEHAPPQRATTILLRTPPATHWLAAGQSELSASFIAAFKNIALAALKQGAIIQPVQAGRIHDVSQLSPIELPILSYHSISTSGRPSLHFKEAALGGYFSLDPNGFSGWASWPQTADIGSISEHDADVFYAQLHYSVVKTGRTKYRQQAKGAIPAGRFVLLALQVPDDAVAQHARISIEETLDTLLDHYSGTPNWVVVKPHPYDMSAATQRMLVSRASTHSNLVVSQAPIHTLIARADCVVTVNSGVGVEALLHLKQVITTGASDYAAVTHSVESTSALKTALTTVDEGGEGAISPANIKRFIYAAYAQYAFTETDVPETCCALIRAHLLGRAPAEGLAGFGD